MDLNECHWHLYKRLGYRHTQREASEDTGEDCHDLQATWGQRNRETDLAGEHLESKTPIEMVYFQQE